MRIENIGFGGLMLKQDPDEFCFGVDAVLLADFANSICSRFGYAVDLCTGTGVIPFILSYKAKGRYDHITGIDVQESSVKMARESCLINGLEESIGFFQLDVAEINHADDLGRLIGDAEWMKAIREGGVDMVTINPPYVAKGSGMVNGNMGKFIARQETTVDLEGFIRASSKLLKRKGHFFMVHRPSRLVDVLYFCRKHRLEPKTLRFVSPGKDKEPNIMLVHCIREGGKELKVMKELVVYGNDGDYSEEIKKIYEKV